MKNFRILGGSMSVNGSVVRAGLHTGSGDSDVQDLKFVTVSWSVNETAGSLLNALFLARLLEA